MARFFLTVSYCDICPLPDSRHLAVGCLTRLAQVGAARGHLRAEPRLPQLNLQYKSRLIQLSKERRKFVQIRESDSLRTSSFTHAQYYGTGFVEAGSGLFSESGSILTQVLWPNIWTFLFIKSNIFFSSRRPWRGSKLHDTPAALKTEHFMSRWLSTKFMPIFQISRIVLVSGMNFFFHIKNCNLLMSSYRRRTSSTSRNEIY